MTTLIRPEYYKQATRSGITVLEALYPLFTSEDFSEECRTVMDRYGWNKDAYLFQAAAYLWRCGAKNTITEDFRKTLWYLKERQLMIQSHGWPLPEGVQIDAAIDIIEGWLRRFD